MVALLATPARAAPAALQVQVDVHFAPDLAAWSQGLAAQCRAWWPQILEVLGSPGFVPPDQVQIVLVKIDPAKVAATTVGTRIYVDAAHVRADPDTGFLAHELAHVAQQYPRGGTKWLKEGIADYLRYYVLLPNDPQRAYPPSLSYQLGYQPAAALLDWIARSYGRRVISAVNAAMRAGRDGEGALAEATGQTPAALWATFKASGGAARKTGAPVGFTRSPASLGQTPPRRTSP